MAMNRRHNISGDCQATGSYPGRHCPDRASVSVFGFPDIEGWVDRRARAARDLMRRSWGGLKDAFWVTRSSSHSLIRVDQKQGAFGSGTATQSDTSQRAAA
jgi:hypothetical protein